ncbi:hypothetical protein MICRO11B_290064 [Micrococcus luteus]|nr:hypothetical protein MICRO11B_290064 [Micrococcus luteus]
MRTCVTYQKMTPEWFAVGSWFCNSDSTMVPKFASTDPPLLRPLGFQGVILPGFRRVA